MNTFRMPTASMDMSSGSTGSYARIGLASVLAIAAVFACFFAIGRAERPAVTPAERLPPSLPAASAGTAIPIVLSTAPQIGTQALTAKRTPVRASSGRAGSAGPAVPPVTVSKTPVATTPVTTAPTSSRGSSGTSTSPGAGKPTAKPKTSSGTSFDSSG